MLNGSGYRSNPADHMANERTFLAWIRTSIAIMAFGFVVEKFTLFVKQIALFLGKPHIDPSQIPTTSPAYSSVFGILLVSLGALLCLLAFIKYKKVEKQLDTDTYRTSAQLELILTLCVLLIGVFLTIYLIQ